MLQIFRIFRTGGGVKIPNPHTRVVPAVESVPKALVPYQVQLLLDPAAPHVLPVGVAPQNATTGPKNHPKLRTPPIWPWGLLHIEEGLHPIARPVSVA